MMGQGAYGDLHVDSVRDVDQLCRDKQWIDAMGLFSFRAIFRRGGDILHWILNEATENI